jgi:hypothetical protein
MGFVASEEFRERQARIESSPLYPEIQRRNLALNQMRDQEGTPEFLRLQQELFDLQDQAAGGGGLPTQAPQDPMQGGIGGLIEALQGQTIPQPPMPTRRPLPTPPLNPNRFISVEEFEGRSPSPSRPDDGIRMRMEGTLDPSRGTRRPDDVYNRGQAPAGMPLPPAPIATKARKPDMVQQLREALRQKQMSGVQRRPMDRRGKGSLGGIIGRLRQQMDQRREIPLPRRYDEEVDDSNFEFTYGKDRLGMPVMSASPRRNVDPNRFISVEEFERGGARPQKPDMEEIRRQIMRGVNVRGIRF